MLLTALEFLWWLQPEATGGGGGGGAAGGGGGAGDAGMGCAMQAGLFGIMMVVFYFFLLRPEQKRRREHEEMMKSLRKGTKVRTTGGILGDVVAVNDDEVVIQIADRVRVNVLRTHVATIESARKDGDKSAKDESKSAKDEKKPKKAEPEAKDAAKDEARDEG